MEVAKRGATSRRGISTAKPAVLSLTRLIWRSCLFYHRSVKVHCRLQDPHLHVRCF
jgi:hypothetical protein